MHVRYLLPVLLACASLSARSQPSDQPGINVITGFSDPEFWAIVEAGPSNSEELERIVTTYAANDMRDVATDAFFRYLQGEGETRDPYCAYCVSLLATVGRPQENDLVELFFGAADRLMEQAYEERSGDRLLPLALMIAMSKNSAIFDRGLYFMTNAVRLGVDDRSRLVVVQFLTDVGDLVDARELATAAFQDQGSVYYQSENAKRWIDFLDKEIARHEHVGAMIVAADWR